jgi:hypothetical protein
MRLFQASQVLALTGLTRSQLREWCSRDRRDLLRPDVEPDGPGRHALYSWQTVLVLRVLRVLHADFAVEVAAWAPAMNELRSRLEGVSFPSLHSCSAHFKSPKHAAIVAGHVPAQGVFIELGPHLAEIAAMLRAPGTEQLPLFPATAVRR